MYELNEPLSLGVGLFALGRDLDEDPTAPALPTLNGVELLASNGLTW